MQLNFVSNFISSLSFQKGGGEEKDTLITIPPGVVIRLRSSIKHEQGAAVLRTLGPDIQQTVPNLNVRVLDLGARGRVECKTGTVFPTGVDAGGQSETLVDVDFDERSIDEDAHLNGLGGVLAIFAVADGVWLEVALVGVVGEHVDLAGVATVHGDAVIGRVVEDVGILLAVGGCSNGETGDAGGALDLHIDLV